MTTIHISDENWQKLNRLKKSGETMDDIVSNLLQMVVDEEPEVSDNRDFEEILDEFIKFQNEQDGVTLDKIIEDSKMGYQSEE